MTTPTIARPAIGAHVPVPRTPRAYPRSWIVLLLVTDVALFVVASALGAMLGFHYWGWQRAVDHLLIADAVFVGLWVLVFDRLGLYRRTYALSMKDELYYTVTALVLGTIPQLLLFTLDPGISTSRIALLYALSFSIVLVGSSRALLHAMRKSRWCRMRRKTTIVGTRERVEKTLESLELGDDADTQVIVVDDVDETVKDLDPMRDVDLGRIEWFRRARAWGCDRLILTEILPPHVLAHLLEIAARDHIALAFAPPRIMRYGYDLSFYTDGRQALIVPARLRACTPRAQLVKRLTDIFFANVALIVFAPIMLVAAIAVYLESGWPIVFTQERVGAGGKRFNILKFRSMVVDAEREVGPVWARANDPRTTRVGAILRRLSIDEMPQIFNVLRGDMSLVGPRPERPVFIDMFRAVLPRYDERHLVRPGITGWSQIHMKRVIATSAAGEKLSYDLQYLENWSLFLDVSVLFQTLCEFLFHRAA